MAGSEEPVKTGDDALDAFENLRKYAHECGWQESP